MSPVMRDVIIEKKRNLSGTEPKVVYVGGIITAIDYDGDGTVKSRPGYVWVKENGQDGGIFQCYNPTVKTNAGLPVIIAHFPTKPMRRMILSVDWDKLPIADRGEPFGILNHARSHEWPTMNPAEDAVNVYPRAIVPLKVFSAQPGVGFGVANGYYVNNGVVTQFTGLSFWDLTDSIPATYKRVSLVYLNMLTNEVEVIDGIEEDDPFPAYPTLPISSFPLAYLLLENGMTRLTEANIIDDARPFISVSQSIGDMRQFITDSLARVEAELDYALSRHIVEG